MAFKMPGPAVLFAPLNRPELAQKAAAKADVVILDLEDGAGGADLDVARQNLLATTNDPVCTWVRVNGPEDENFSKDVAALRETDYQVVVVPKITTYIPAELEDYQIIALIETPQAVLQLQQIAAHPAVVGLYWGAEDLTFFTGGTHSRFGADEGDRAGRYRNMLAVARSQMLFAAAAYGKIAIDAVYADFSDDDGLYLEAIDACRSGFAGNAIIHPRQVEPVRRAYRPTRAQFDWAKRVVERAAQAPGAFKLDGEMVDAPLIAQAHRVVSRGTELGVSEA